jgi:hypothetical protein
VHHFNSLQLEYVRIKKKIFVFTTYKFKISEFTDDYLPSVQKSERKYYRLLSMGTTLMVYSKTMAASEIDWLYSRFLRLQQVKCLTSGRIRTETTRNLQR